MKKYSAIATAEFYYDFDESVIPDGMTPEQWAEEAWEYGAFNIDGHEMKVEEV
jgi:hypothetical protein